MSQRENRRVIRRRRFGCGRVEDSSELPRDGVRSGRWSGPVAVALVGRTARLDPLEAVVADAQPPRLAQERRRVVPACRVVADDQTPNASMREAQVGGEHAVQPAQRLARSRR